MPPPVSFITISAMPFSQVVTLAMFNVAHVQWFKYTATVPIVIGLQVTMGGTFDPRTTLYNYDTADVSSPVDHAIGHWWPLRVPGDYYIEITRVGGGASDVDFTVTVETTPLDVIVFAAGDLLINDDVVELPEMRQEPYVRPPMHEQTFVPQIY